MGHMRIHRILFPTALSLLFGSLLAAQPHPAPKLAGRWEGKIAGRLRIIFELKQDASGAYEATLESPDQGAGTFGANSVKVEGTAVEIRFDPIRAFWTGTLSNGALLGKWNQGGASTALDL